MRNDLKNFQKKNLNYLREQNVKNDKKKYFHGTHEKFSTVIEAVM